MENERGVEKKGRQGRMRGERERGGDEEEWMGERRG